MEEQIKKQYSFLSDEISEARMYRQRNTTDRMTLQDTANFAFLNTLLLYILYNEYESSPAAVDYADRTMRYQNFNTYKNGGTDLYFAYYSLLGKDGNTSRVHGGNKDANDLFADRINMPTPMLRKFFNDMASNRLDPRFVQRFFLRLERGLNIQTQNYRSIRRLVMDWPHLNQMEKKLSVTRLLQFFRKGYRRAELYPYLEMLSSGGYELKGAKDAEKKGLGKGAKAAAAFAGGFAAATALGAIGSGYRRGRDSFGYDRAPDYTKTRRQ